jgi:hypothetical protein
MKRIPVTPSDQLTAVLIASIGIERIIRENNRDIIKAQSTRKKILDIINKDSPK